MVTLHSNRLYRLRRKRTPVTRRAAGSSDLRLVLAKAPAQTLAK